jgi:peptide/nickel transport system permease protein
MTTLDTSSPTGAAAVAVPAPAEPTHRKRSRVRTVLVGAAITWIVVIAVLAVFADLLPLKNYDVADFKSIRVRPGWRWTEFLGTDDLGRSMLSRIVYGGRVSLAIGFFCPIIGLVVGGVFGMLAGFRGGILDRIFNVVSNSMLAFPPLILLAVLGFVLGNSLFNIVVALSLVNIPTFARIARANTLSLREREYVLAARTLGAKNRRILWREIAPNLIFPLLAFAFVISAVLIIAEGTLSFLNLSIPDPIPSWGKMIAKGRERLDTDPHLVVIPAIVFFLTVFSVNTIGDHLRHKFATRESLL